MSGRMNERGGGLLFFHELLLLYKYGLVMVGDLEWLGEMNMEKHNKTSGCVYQPNR